MEALSGHISRCCLLNPDVRQGGHLENESEGAAESALIQVSPKNPPLHLS